MEFETLLKKLTCADCKDDGEKFTVSSRLDVISEMLAESEWNLIAKGNLCHIYSRHQLQADQEIVLISSHVDCVYSQLFLETQDDMLRGTFDNALTNAAVVKMMTDNRLPEGVIVAFTGDEERNSSGAKEVVNYLSEIGCYVRFIVVTDVTNVGCDHGLSFTIENDLNIDLLTAHNIIEHMKKYAGAYGFVHEAMPDETWLYYEYKLPCLTLCHPVGGDMHSDCGSTIRKSSAATYCDALSDLCKITTGDI